MKKNVMVKLVLLLLPVMAVVLATTGNSVKVFDITTETVQSYSYFTALPVENMQMLTPLAAMLAVVTLVLAVIYMIAEKRWCVQGIRYTAALSTCAAAAPNLIRRDVLVMPNVLLPILMAVVFVVANIVRKKPEEKPTGERLELRK
ncbi:MAG: hypothetical protein IKK72_00240 [Oscillospiraceae bacterium]|nr:hypothetical protein [Oscillospiraceae bacterium]